MAGTAGGVSAGDPDACDGDGDVVVGDDGVGVGDDGVGGAPVVVVVSVEDDPHAARDSTAAVAAIGAPRRRRLMVVPNKVPIVRLMLPQPGARPGPRGTTRTAPGRGWDGTGCGGGTAPGHDRHPWVGSSPMTPPGLPQPPPTGASALPAGTYDGHGGAW